ncbi:MAG: C4-dicarboxylate transporter substrate-binding protein [Clostridia bacterium]|jgi:tripartite ATP-independent transporter DctP family solute receptor|nr:C4-dicarboxylate transporter substrate-binding protein [Clostridia bacterium]
MNKKIAAILLSGLLAVSFSGCGLKSPEAPAPTAPAATEEAKPEETKPAEEATAAEPEVTLVYAEVNPLDTIVGQTDTFFQEKVAELSGGKIKIDVQASGVLGSENDVLDAMLGGGGTIDMSRISAFGLTSYGGEKSKLLSIPYTFVNREHFWNFATSDLAPEFLVEPHENGSGVRGLFYGEEGFRHFFTVKPVNKLEDLKGMKLRVANDPIMNGMVEGLGASPTVVSFGELYSALQTGVVDGAEQPIANYKSNAFQEVAPNMILDGHTLGAIQVIITDEAWDGLTEEQQKILMEAGKLASEFNRQISEEAENKVLEELKAGGTNIVEVKDIAPWQAAVKATIESASKDNAELYQKILDMK